MKIRGSMKRTLTITAVLVILAFTAHAAQVGIPYQFSSGQKIVASEVNANFNTLSNVINGNIASDNIVNGGIITADISDSAIDTSKIANLSVTTPKLAVQSVTHEKLASESVTTASIATAAVTTAKINDGAVTAAKLATSLGKVSTSVLTGASLEWVYFNKSTGSNCDGNPCNIATSSSTTAVTNVARGSTGTYTITFNTGIFVAEPVCVCSANIDGGDSATQCSSAARGGGSATSIGIFCTNSAGALADCRAAVVCVGINL